MTHPTDALRLVPDNEDAPTNRKLARALSNHLEVMVVERSDPSLELTEQSLEEVIDELAAAPASPLPGGGMDEIMAILREEIKCDATGLAPAVASVYLTGFDRAAQRILALPAAPTGDRP